MAISRGNLEGDKDGLNDIFTIPVVPVSNSELIMFNGSVLHPVGSFSSGSARNMECIISGQTVQTGLKPEANDKLYYRCDVA